MRPVKMSVGELLALQRELEMDKPRSVDKSKKMVERSKPFARGSKTPMHGRGDRTKVDTEDSAGTQKPGTTTQKAKDNRQFAEGGEDRSAVASSKETPFRGGFSVPAKPGATGPR